MYKSTKNAYRFVNCSSSVPGTNKIIKTPFALLYSKVAKLKTTSFSCCLPSVSASCSTNSTFKRLLKNIMFWLWGNTHSLDFGWLMLFTWGHFTLIECRTVLCQCEAANQNCFPVNMEASPVEQWKAATKSWNRKVTKLAGCLVYK